MIHSMILFWMPMYAYYGDVIWSSGREGGYLVLGNMVYTVSFNSPTFAPFFIIWIDFILVRCGDSLSEGGIDNKLVDVANALLHLGVDRSLVLIYVQLQVRLMAVMNLNHLFKSILFLATFGRQFELAPSSLEPITWYSAALYSGWV